MTEISLRFLGHSGLFLKAGGVGLLCDPWFSEEGAFLCSWHQFPPNHFIDKESLYDADYLYLSHPHQDHFDHKFLRTFPKHKVIVIIADFLSKNFAKQIADLGFSRVIELRDWNAYELANGLTATIVKDQSLYKIDSCILIKADRLTLLNKNDCHISGDYSLRFKEYAINLLFGQFSGAMWYPATYCYSAAKQRQIAGGIRRNLIDSFVEFTNGVGAKHVMHCAGPPCFLEDDLFQLNFQENGIFHDQNDVFAELSQRLNGSVHLLLPGDEVKFHANGEPYVLGSQSFDFSRKVDFLNEYRQKRAHVIAAFIGGLTEPKMEFISQFEEYLQMLFSSNIYVREKIKALVRFKITGVHDGSIYIDTRVGRFGISRSCSEKPNYTFEMPSYIAALLVENKVTWEELLLSMRLSLIRDPDVYNWPLFAILRYGHEPILIAQIERIMKAADGETIAVKCDGRYYVVQRYCPHAGEDLSHAKIHDGKLICRRHEWTFDLRDGGKCISGGSLSLKVYDAPDPENREGQNK